MQTHRNDARPGGLSRGVAAGCPRSLNPVGAAWHRSVPSSVHDLPELTQLGAVLCDAGGVLLLPVGTWKGCQPGARRRKRYYLTGIRAPGDLFGRPARGSRERRILRA